MTFENTCKNCPHAEIIGSILFRSCSIASKGHGDIFIQCIMRPELGYFEPSIRKSECPVWRESEMVQTV
jgi:hypothetical protein